MVNPLDFIPKLSGFSPMPLGIMAPFMGYQSAALAYNFGLNYEFGKRVIKSMSNEQFNKIANDPILLNELTAKHHDVLLKAFINEVPKVQPIQKLIIDELVKLEFEKIKIMPKLISQIPKGFIEGLFNLQSGGSAPDLVIEPDVPPAPTPPPTVTPPRGSPKPPSTIVGTVSRLQNFSDIPVALQKSILVMMSEISRLDKLRREQTRAVRGALRVTIIKISSRWKLQYKAIKGYKNPLPVEAMPWLEADVKSLLRGWENEV